MTSTPFARDRQAALDALGQTLGPRRVLFAAFHGSYLYGTQTAASDLDVRAVFVPTAEEILLGQTDFSIDNNPDKKRLGLGDVDVSAFSFARFLKLLGKFDVNAVEMLFASEPGTHALITADAEVMAQVRQDAPFLVATGGSSPIGHARAVLGALAPDQDDYVEAFERGVAALEKGKTDADPDGRTTRLYQVPGLLAELRALPGAAWRAHGQDGDAVTLEADIPAEVLEAGRWPHHTLFVLVADRMVPTSMTVMEAKAVLDKPLRRLKGEVAARRARLEGVPVSTKDIYHAVRILWQFVEIQQTGRLTFPRPKADVLRAVRSGECAGPALQDLIDAAFHDAMAAKGQPMPFPETPDKTRRDALVVQVHRSEILRA